MSARQPARAVRTLAAVFWGMHGHFSDTALRSYLAARGQVRAIFVPLRAAPWETQAPPWRPVEPVARRHSSLPMLTTAIEPSVLSLAAERDIAAFEIADPRALETADLLASLEAEVGCVACWPTRIPGAVLARFPVGMLNLHPSLLPLHRGPAPLFWTLRHGDANAGVTVHLMDDTLDGGPILAQRHVALDDGLSGFALEERCAAEGGKLLARCVRDLAGGRAHPRPQEPGAGSYEPWPQASDFVVTGDSSARAAYAFIRGAAYWGGPVTLDCAGTRFTVREALGYALDEDLDVSCRAEGSEVLMRCRPGVLRVSIEAP